MNNTAPELPPDLMAAIARHWGYTTLRPLQAPAMQAVLEGRDSLLVLPTGGGKSICYQAPALVLPGLTVVVSPLIALMKDQVDGLVNMGIAAVQLDSSLTEAQRRQAGSMLRSGMARLLFVSPERLANPQFRQWLVDMDVRRIAIDEAHCISHWGHDFRPEYRQLAELRTVFPNASFHGFTATATGPVREDICRQLGLNAAQVFVGNFDRPNLTYRVIARADPVAQVLELLSQHAGEAGIVYCISRREVDSTTQRLAGRGVKVAGYHAGMTAQQRQEAQDAFVNEKVDVMVATVAFGMGIDRSDIRFVAHTGMPKSIEHYQQETGRAGRDGLEAECVLLYSGADLMTWKNLIERSAAEAGQTDHVPLALKHLDDMDRYCRAGACRHKALVEYFGKAYEGAGCNGCDVCLGHHQDVPDSQIVAQKILSAVARTQERFGIGHVVGVLRGENTQRIRELGHDRLPTYGTLRDMGKAELRDSIYQLIAQRALVQEGTEYPVLRLNAQSWQVLRGNSTVRLVRTIERSASKAASAEVSWDGVDRPVFEALREFRRKTAQDAGVPPYVVFSDATLRELARVRPTTLAAMRMVYGIGEAKLAAHGQATLACIDRACASRGLSRDQPPAQPVAAPRGASSRPSPERAQAIAMFRTGASVEAVAKAVGRKPPTVWEYLATFVREERPKSLAPWVDPATEAQVVQACRRLGHGLLKPIFLALDQRVPYELIRVVVAGMAAAAPAGGEENEKSPPPAR